MRNSIYVFGLILLVFACEPSDNIVPNFESTTGGDDEDPIIQGGVMFPDEVYEADTLVSLINADTGKVIDFTLTNDAGQFVFQMPRGENLMIEVVCQNGEFTKSEPFSIDALPALLKV